MIELSGVDFAYRGRAVFEALDLVVPRGLVLLLGPNGAGKSTLLKLAAGIEKPDRGSVRVLGHDLWTDEAEARRALAYLPEYPDLTPYATVLEVLRLVARLRGLAAAEAPRVLEQVGLAGLGGRTVRELSLGQRRRAVLGAALLGRPPVVLLDEPLESLDRTLREAVVAWTFERAADGLALVATHDLAPFADRADAVVAVTPGTGARVETLPPPGAERDALLERWARG